MVRVQDGPRRTSAAGTNTVDTNVDESHLWNGRNGEATFKDIQLKGRVRQTWFSGLVPLAGHGGHECHAPR